MGYKSNLAYYRRKKMVTSKTLNLFDNFTQLTPYVVGFDRIFNQLNTYADNNRTSTGFPPYNIRKGGDYNYVIEMAVAGFGKTDIEVELEDCTLTVRSVKEKDKSPDDIYHGISCRKFNRKFTIADDIIVKNVNLVNGMLTIDLESEVPENKKSRLIEISTSE
jgi:molecular chaperone IbpA|tara:strand:- start:2160 stop:2648 length:489 start_codon:yes stop_codon:yes gene_type:complete